MAYIEEKPISMGNLKAAMGRVKVELETKIANSSHLKQKKVDVVPDPSVAEENVHYLVKNATTGHFDIYTLIDGKMELLDDTAVNLEMATDAEVEEMLNEVFADAPTE